jgi:hypothetical protein
MFKIIAVVVIGVLVEIGFYDLGQEALAFGVPGHVREFSDA